MHDIQKLTDSEILEFIKKKDRQVFGDIFKLYRSNLHKYATLFIEDDEVIEDLIQDIFVKLWFNAEEIGVSKSLKSYLFRVVHNNCLNYIRHQKIVDKYYKEQAYYGESVSKNTMPEPYLKEAINKAITSLPALTKEIFVLSRIDGFKHDEIAEKLKISKKTVEAHLSKATIKLRNDLKIYSPLLLLIIIIYLKG